MTTADFNDKDKKPVKCDAELHCTAAPQLAKTVAEELKDEDKDLETLLKILQKESQSATE